MQAKTKVEANGQGVTWVSWVIKPASVRPDNQAASTARGDISIIPRLSTISWKRHIITIFWFPSNNGVNFIFFFCFICFWFRNSENKYLIRWTALMSKVFNFFFFSRNACLHYWGTKNSKCVLVYSYTGFTLVLVTRLATGRNIRVRRRTTVHHFDTRMRTWTTWM